MLPNKPILVGAVIRRPFGRHNRKGPENSLLILGDLADEARAALARLSVREFNCETTLVTDDEFRHPITSTGVTLRARIIHPHVKYRGEYAALVRASREQFGLPVSGLPIAPDVWIDVANDAVITFDRLYVVRLRNLLRLRGRDLAGAVDLPQHQPSIQGATHEHE